MQEIKLVNFEYYICIVDQYVGKENGTIVARIMNQYLLYYMYICTCVCMEIHFFRCIHEDINLHRHP